MRPGLLLIDLQRDYLAHEAMTPPPSLLIPRVARLLEIFRERQLPVVHAHTLVRRDGSNRMPHWQRHDRWACVEGTDGAQPPPELAPCAGERVFAKPFYSAWGDPALPAHVRELAVDTLVVAGLYTHACIRASVLDAYQAGLEVWLATDAVGSYDALHAELTRQHLDGRACCALTVDGICARLGHAPTQVNTGSAALPVAHIDGTWQPHRDQPLAARHDPTDWQTCRARVPLGSAEDMAQAVQAAAARQPAWANVDPAQRRAALTQWSEALVRRRDQIVAQLVAELGKPVRDARAEFDYALALLAAVGRDLERGAVERVAPGVEVRHCPVGTVGLITPWNNPVALPVGKLAPAIAWGNAAVWKPAIEAPRTAMLLMDTLAETSLPGGCVSMIFGDDRTAAHLLHDARIAAISFTGSPQAGGQVRAACIAHHRPFQAELGGNNGVVVAAACDVDAAAGEIADAAFRFAGQRCTAPRRIIVERPIYERFSEAIMAAVANLRVGLPTDEQTQVGPLVSRAAQQRIAAIVNTAVEQGALRLCGGRVPPGRESGCWYEPTVLSDLDLGADIVRQESFGPVIALMPARDMDEAMRLLNAVEHGLVATLYCDDPTIQQRFAAAAETGIVRFNAAGAPIHPAAPFGGWKASGDGPPEHGPYDRAVYTRPQARYGRATE
ncbi:MAG: aldehyde dehydrogenase family protein [Phycisphaeraceae bacterium]